VVGEFDGEEKYVKAHHLNGRSTCQAVVAEKKRENRIRATWMNVAHWDSADLMEPGTLERELVAAGVPGRRQGICPAQAGGVGDRTAWPAKHRNRPGGGFGAFPQIPAQ